MFRYPLEEDLEKYCATGLLALNLIVSLFVFPVFILFLVQIKNVFKNKTTYERTRGLVTDSSMKSEVQKNKNKVSLRNCKVMCSDTRGSFLTNNSN